MILCRVIGSAVQPSTSRRSGPENDPPLLIVQPVNAGGQRVGGEIVAEARVRTTVGDLVLVEPDRRTREQSGTTAVRAVAIAVVEGLKDQHRSS